MLIKAMLIPLILIVCFGGGFVALHKPFNLKAVALIVALAVSLLIMGFTGGFIRVIGALGVVVSLFGIYAVRGKR
ncbi:MAG: hypothetical protein WCG75_04490 [Armatimonadota bacterium]